MREAQQCLDALPSGSLLVEAEAEGVSRHRRVTECFARLAVVTTSSPKDDLQRYLQAAREGLLWKLEGLSEDDARRPMVPTGTNLLGLVKHVAATEAGYLGATFSRPFP